MRPYWTDYFLGLAKVISKRSHDIHTQHGCVITDKQHRILGVGYNGFPRGLEDSELPLSRPEKYPWMIHSEVNAVNNCTVRPDKGTAYVTGQCCNSCIMHLYQNGIDEVFMINSHGTHLFDEYQQELFDRFVRMSKMNVHYIEPNFEWMHSL